MLYIYKVCWKVNMIIVDLSVTRVRPITVEDTGGTCGT